MIKPISIIRVLILIGLLLTAVFLIFSTPAEDSLTWYTDLILSKIFGALSAWLSYKLSKRWKSDRLVSKLLFPKY